ncbi:hypothetical protein AMECASPLE_016949 [Ameca splendens]|uniref:Uncharacterized protein n=1 Tax=Ameca splendens TaxID=208324 RepID=A0ABV1A8Q6_9TELE
MLQQTLSSQSSAHADGTAAPPSSQQLSHSRDATSPNPEKSSGEVPSPSSSPSSSPKDVVVAPIERSLTPGDRDLPSACLSCLKWICLKVQSALDLLSATPNQSDN